MMVATILVLEDETANAKALEDILRKEGYRVFCASDVPGGKLIANSNDIDLALLDVNLKSLTRLTKQGEPLLLTQEGQEGFEFASWFRDSYPAARIIFLTARNSVSDRVRGLDLGGDDYLAKPIHTDELIARVRANLRRMKKSVTREEVIGRWLFELGSNEMRHLDNKNLKRIRITFAESRLLTALIEGHGEVISRERLSKVAFGRPLTQGDRAVDTSISKLRTKIDTGSANDGSLIQTIHGQGYRIKK